MIIAGCSGKPGYLVLYHAAISSTSAAVAPILRRAVAALPIQEPETSGCEPVASVIASNSGSRALGLRAMPTRGFLNSGSLPLAIRAASVLILCTAQPDGCHSHPGPASVPLPESDS